MEDGWAAVSDLTAAFTRSFGGVLCSKETPKDWKGAKATPWGPQWSKWVENSGSLETPA